MSNSKFVDNNAMFSTYANRLHPFYFTRYITEWTSNYDGFKYLDSIFYYISIKKWDLDLPRLTKISTPNGMFSLSSNLKTFNGDLSALTNGLRMFLDTGLVHFYAGKNGLKKLTDAKDMFLNTKLDNKSLQYIVNQLPTMPDTLDESSKPTIHIDVDTALVKEEDFIEAQVTIMVEKHWNFSTNTNYNSYYY